MKKAGLKHWFQLSSATNIHESKPHAVSLWIILQYNTSSESQKF